MSEKTITRYAVTAFRRTGLFRRKTRIDVPIVTLADHEAALAAERMMGKQAKRLLENQLSALRTAIEAKANRFKQQAQDAKDAGDMTWAARCLAAETELRALLEKKP